MADSIQAIGEPAPPVGSEQRAATGQIEYTDRLQPLLAGARARGMADAFEMIGAPVIFLDETGSVLHTSRAAAEFLGGDICLTGASLVGRNADLNKRIERFIHRVVCTSDAPEEMSDFKGRQDGCRFNMRPLPLDASAGDPYQLLAAVVVFERAELVGANLAK